MTPAERIAAQDRLMAEYLARPKPQPKRARWPHPWNGYRDPKTAHFRQMAADEGRLRQQVRNRRRLERLKGGD
jgi:hypothetical protein